MGLESYMQQAVKALLFEQGLSCSENLRQEAGTDIRKYSFANRTIKTGTN
jgi:hypothetical protein